MTPTRSLFVVAAPLAMLTACAGPQSALATSGREAEWISVLFWWMTGGALIVWLAVIALTLYCMRRQGRGNVRRFSRVLIVGGGAVVPTIVLTVLLVYGLSMLPQLVARAPDGSLQVHVVGEQWWWRVRYVPAGREPIELANEIRLPVGEPVQFRLESDNVIHSFWIPALAGKMDMIPGRVTHLAMQPTRTGLFRGACAEYCGTSHAGMAFYVQVMEREAFARWLDGQSRAAAPLADSLAQRGEELFFANGCSACHTVRGTPARGVIGPDLTHVGSRLSVGAGILPSGRQALERWLRRTEHIKPGVHMPQFGMLPSEEISALAVYLGGLQ